MHNKNLFNFYASVELIISSLLLMHSIVQKNSILGFIGILLIASSIYSFWKKDELRFQLKHLENQVDQISAFMCFFIAALIYYLDVTY